MSTTVRPSPSPIRGRATREGCARFAERFLARFAPDFFRPLGPEEWLVSSVGLGTYLGDCAERDDAGYLETAHHALASGVNLIDTAINYRCQRSERTLGRVLSRAVRGDTVARDEVVVCSKGGYIPLDDVTPPSREEYREYVQREYFDAGIVTPAEVVAGGHCLAPAYLADQLARSRANLGLETIDVYYLHNPEQQLDVVAPDELESRLRVAFALLEERAAAGEIGVYGVATWNGFRVPPDVRGHLSLARLVAIAREVGGASHRFRVVQVPINLAMAEALRAPTQPMPDGAAVPLLEAASKLGVSVVASASLLQARLTSLPAELRQALPGYTTDAQRAIAFVRGLPVVTAALVGMKRLEHLRENLVAGRKR